MPFAIDRLDTQAPAHWDGTSFRDGDPHVDAGSALRPINGEDPVNYFPHHRAGGDLFNRDLGLEVNLQKVVDYLGSRTGLLYQIPAVRLLAADTIYIARIKVPASHNLYIVAAEITNVTNTDALVLTIVPVLGGAAVFTKNTLGSAFTGAAITDRGTELTATTEYDVLLNNPTGNTVVAFGSVTLQPKVL